MTETIAEEASSSNSLMTTKTNASVKESGINNENEEAWLYGKQKVDETVLVFEVVSSCELLN